MKHAYYKALIPKEEIVDLLFQLDESDVVDIIKIYNDYNASINFEKTMLKYFEEARSDYK